MLIDFFDNIVTRVKSNTTVSDQNSSVFRIAFGMYMLFVITPSFIWLDQVPNALYDPPLLSFTNLFDSFPSRNILQGLDILVVISLIAITFGVKTRWATLLLFITCFVGFSFQNSIGKIEHNSLFLALVFCFVFTNWGVTNALLPDKRLKFDNIAISIFAIIVCFGYLTSGIPKLLNWIDFNTSTSGFLKWWCQSLFSQNTQGALSNYVGRLNPLVLELMDYGAVLFEMSAFVALIYSRNSWKLWLLFGCLFHLANYLLLSISFIIYVPVYAALIMASIKFEDSKAKYINFVVLFCILLSILLLKFGPYYNDEFNAIFFRRVEEVLSWFGLAFIVGFSLLSSNNLLGRLKIF